MFTRHFWQAGIIIILSLATAIAACERKKTPSCEEAVGELTHWMKTVDDFRAKVSCGPSYSAKDYVIAKEISTPLACATKVEIDSSSRVAVDEVSLDDKPVADGIAELVGRAKEKADLYSKHNPRQKPLETVNLAIYRQARWSSIVHTLKGVGRAGLKKVTFLFRPESVDRPAPPPDSELERRLQKIEKRVREKGKDIFFSMDAFTKDVAACPELARALEAYDKAQIEQKWSILNERFSEALKQCRCKVDPGVVKSIAWRLIGMDSARLLVTLTLSLDNATGETCQPIRASAPTPWEDVAPKILAADPKRPICPEIQD
jgi:hypothetical protein